MNLRISLNVNKITGPYGGSVNFANNLESYLTSRGHTVVNDLVPALDLIVIISSRPNPRTTSYIPAEIGKYLQISPNTVVVHRVNDCDESRAQDIGTNAAVIAANQLADHTVFVSRFMRELYGGQGFDQARPHTVILTGVAEKIFNPEGRADLRQGERINLVTHHWSTNVMKGFDLYERMDQVLRQEPFSNLFTFTLIGNVPPGFTFTRTRLIPPCAGMELASNLKECHAYLTGTRNEPGGNHYIEAMRCGLPVLYLESGSTAEYCREYGGVGFTPVDFEEKLLEMHSNYYLNKTKVLECPFTDSWMAAQYESLFLTLVENRRKSLKPPAGFLVKRKYNLRRRLRKIRRYLSGRVLSGRKVLS